MLATDADLIDEENALTSFDLNRYHVHGQLLTSSHEVEVKNEPDIILNETRIKYITFSMSIIFN